MFYQGAFIRMCTTVVKVKTDETELQINTVRTRASVFFKPSTCQIFYQFLKLFAFECGHWNRYTHTRISLFEVYWILNPEDQTLAQHSQLQRWHTYFFHFLIPELRCHNIQQTKKREIQVIKRISQKAFNGVMHNKYLTSLLNSKSYCLILGTHPLGSGRGNKFAECILMVKSGESKA